MEKVGLVLSGGGARGLAHIGVLNALEEMMLKPSVVVGTSMGGIIGGLYTYGFSPLELRELSKTLKFEDVLEKRSPLYFYYKNLEKSEKSKAQKILSMEIALSYLITRRGFDSGRKVRKIFKELTHSAKIEDLKTKFASVAVDLRTGQRVVFKSGFLCEAIYSTMAIPPYFEPYEWNGYSLIDGGIISNAPVDVARSVGSTRVVTIDVNAKQTMQLRNNFENAFDVLFRIFEIQEDKIYLEELSKSDLLIQVPLNVGLFEFNLLDECIKRGKEAVFEKKDDLEKVWGVK